MSIQDSILSDSHVGGYEEFEGIFGGCDEKYGMGGLVAVLLLVTSILLLYYVVRMMYNVQGMQSREGICGGKDEMCLCDGNETMSGGKKDFEFNEDTLSLVSTGL